MNTTTQEVFENKYLYLWKEADILFSKYKDDAVIGYEAALEIVKYRRTVFPGRHLCVIYMNKLGCITKDAKEYFASAEPNKDIIKGAFINTNPVFCFFLNAFFRIYKPVVPVKMFTRKTLAVEWLNKID